MTMKIRCVKPLKSPEFNHIEHKEEILAMLCLLATTITHTKLGNIFHKNYAALRRLWHVLAQHLRHISDGFSFDLSPLCIILQYQK